jgi:sec-independent protein translocase protein TatA
MNSSERGFSWSFDYDNNLGENIMLGGFGVTELLIVLVIVLVLFGVGRISKIAGEMGSGIKAFKDGLQGPEGKEENQEEEPVEESKA